MVYGPVLFNGYPSTVYLLIHEEVVVRGSGITRPRYAYFLVIDGQEIGRLQPGATVHAEELARLASPYTVDNLEGLAATKGPRGETLLWLVSDDNFNPFQRTLLLLFELAP